MARPVYSAHRHMSAPAHALARYIEEWEEARDDDEDWWRPDIVLTGVALTLAGRPWLLSCRRLGLIATPGEFVNGVAIYDQGGEDNITERWVHTTTIPADILACLEADRAPGRRSRLDSLGDDRAEALAAQLIDALEPVLPERFAAQGGDGWFAIKVPPGFPVVILPLQEMDLCTPDVTARAVRFVLDTVQMAVTRSLHAVWPHPGAVAYAERVGVDEIRAGYGDPCNPALELHPLISP